MNKEDIKKKIVSTKQNLKSGSILFIVGSLMLLSARINSVFTFIIGIIGEGAILVSIIILTYNLIRILILRKNIKNYA